MTPRLGWVAAAVLAVCLPSCSKAPSQRQAPAAASTSASAAVSVAAPRTSSAELGIAAPLPPALHGVICRAIRVEGEVRQGDMPLSSGAEIAGADWITLGKGASFTLKHSSSGRELSFAGPARLRACSRGREQVLLARGKLEVGSGLGARPGAEVLVATPIAAVRYADADLVLALDDQKLEVTLRAGQAEVDPALPQQTGVKSPLRGKDQLRLRFPPGKVDPAGLMARCKEAAEAAEASARHVRDKTAAEPLGQRAQANVRARRTARAACSIAAAATGLVADPAASAGLWAEAQRWEGLWESIPGPPVVTPGSGPEK
ncbi:MAG TPA: hypothetical protein VHB79_00415 [Polyangiaceae bacterium]|nr:hypothetical protein [Polyangiaceae bacterium]